MLPDDKLRWILSFDSSLLLAENRLTCNSLVASRVSNRFSGLSIPGISNSDTAWTAIRTGSFDKESVQRMTPLSLQDKWQRESDKFLASWACVCVCVIEKWRWLHDWCCVVIELIEDEIDYYLSSTHTHTHKSLLGWILCVRCCVFQVRRHRLETLFVASSHWYLIFSSHRGLSSVLSTLTKMR